MARMDPDLKERFDEMRDCFQDLQRELKETRHGLKGSVDQMAVQIAENVWQIKAGERRTEKIEDALDQHARDHEARLRMLENIAAAMETLPARVEKVEQDARRLESVQATAGRFTWGDVWKSVAGLTALTGFVGGLIAIARALAASGHA